MPKSGRVYVGSEDMHVYAFALHDGRQVWRSDKLPGVSLRGYHPVVAPDGAVLVTVTPAASLDRMASVLLDMVKEVFGDFASWRHSKEENVRLREANFELMKKPDTYRRQMDYLRRRLHGGTLRCRRCSSSIRPPASSGLWRRSCTRRA